MLCVSLVWPFTFYSNTAQLTVYFPLLQKSVQNDKFRNPCFSQSLEQFFLTVGQNNFGKKIPFHLVVRRISKWVNKEGFFAYILGQTIKRFCFAFCYIFAQIRLKRIYSWTLNWHASTLIINFENQWSTGFPYI